MEKQEWITLVLPKSVLTVVSVSILRLSRELLREHYELKKQGFFHAAERIKSDVESELQTFVYAVEGAIEKPKLASSENKI